MLSINFDSTPAQQPRVFQDSTLETRLEGDVSQRLFAISSIRKVAPKTLVFCQNEPADHVYEVIEGVLKLYMLTTDGRVQVTGFAYPGQILALDATNVHITTAEAVTGAKLCQYPRAKFGRIIDDHPKLARLLFTVVAQDLNIAHTQMLLLGRKSATEKIASFLLDLSRRNETSGQDPTVIDLPMSRGDIGDYLGLTIETVSRTITRLKRMGVVDLRQQRTIGLRDIESLQELAESDEFANAS